MRHVIARPEQSPLDRIGTSAGLPCLSIIRADLRAAALAPTVYDALDVTGDALRRIAETLCVEGQQ
jgi:hypothetical protein